MKEPVVRKLVIILGEEKEYFTVILPRPFHKGSFVKIEKLSDEPMRILFTIEKNEEKK